MLGEPRCLVTLHCVQEGKWFYGLGFLWLIFVADVFGVGEAEIRIVPPLVAD